jgi:SAM-dependent methyltransferase
MTNGKHEALGPFTCNICGHRNASLQDAGEREKRSCSSCGSSIRVRAILLTLSRALFGLELSVADFPMLKSIRGLGISDSDIYSGSLERCFSYTNTFYHREPALDLSNPDEKEFGRYDFVICSEVLEHIAPPVDRAFQTLARLLKPAGVLILTVPYVPIPSSIEHFPELQEYGLADINGTTVLVNRSMDGSYQVYDRLSFHGGRGSTLEMRVFSETAVQSMLIEAGLSNICIGGKESREFGVVLSGPCSLPMAASRGPFTLNPSGITELVEELTLKRKTLEMVQESHWVRLGRRLGVGPKLSANKRVTLKQESAY